MPAIAKLMHMKGHNGKHPCRACRIGGVRNPHPIPGDDNKTNYTPLSRPFTTGRHEPRTIDPLDLPRRTHSEFIMHAMLVGSSHNDAEADRRARHYGINSLSPLSRLSSLDFPASFPHDFMHAVFENVIPMLIDLWTHSCKFLTFGTGDEGYVLDKAVWNNIGATCANSGDMIPAVFGCRIPNLAQDRSQTTAESNLLFTTLLAPALLRDQFKAHCYYDHFLQFVQLIDSCMAFELSHELVQRVREGFTKWVVDFERLYYRHTPNRLCVCTLPLHSLLHIADDIEAMGPVWCYWAFPMERFCGALGRANLNPRFPFVSMDRRVLEVAQLAQVKYMYHLFDALDLGEHKNATAKGVRYPGYPHSIFVRPRRVISADGPLARQLGAYLANLYDVDAKLVECRIRGHEFDAWGKMQLTIQSGGLDMIMGYSLLPDSLAPRRSSTFVKYISEWDRSVRGRPKHVANGTYAFGRVEHFLILDADVIKGLIADGYDRQDDDDAPTRLALAVISPIPSFKRLKDSNLVTYKLSGERLGPIEIVDVEDVVCLVGRVQYPAGKWYVIDRTCVVGKINFVNSVMDTN